MVDFRLLITDLTEYGALRCVAGWDVDRGQMVRPEPAPAQFWQQDMTGSGNVLDPGNIVTFAADKPKPPTTLPHYNEDRVLVGLPKLYKRMERPDFAKRLKAIGGSADHLFRKPVEFSNSKAYIPTSTDCPSLYGINIERGAVEFFETSYDGKSKPRCRISIKELVVDLSVAAVDLRQLFYSKGVAGLRARFAKDKLLHVRIGLARGFASFPDRCYMQVNGIVGLDA